MKRPLVGVAMVYAGGIWVGALRPWPVDWLYLCAFICLAAFLISYRTRFSLAPLLAALAVTGAIAYRQATGNFPAHHISRLLPARDQNVKLRGVIVSDPGFREQADEDDDRPGFRLDLEAVRVNDAWLPATGRLFMFVSASRPTEALRYGDRIECTALLRVPPGARNPGTFDWQRWLARQGIHFTATLRAADECRVVAQNCGHPIRAFSLRWRDRFERALELGLEQEPKLAGVLAGMVIGERSEIPPDTYATFQQTGVCHVFAISGLHVALVTGVLVVALRLVRVPRRWIAVPAIPLLVLYVLATGARPGAVRAAVMASVWLVGGMLVRPCDLLNTLATAAVLLLVWEPAQLFNGGFVLSFGAVTSLVLLTPVIEPRLQAWTAPDPLLPARLRSWWAQRVDKGRRWLMMLVSCSLAAWVGLVPLMAWYFNLFSPIGILANVLVIPLLGVILAVGLGAMAAHLVCPAMTLLLNNANYFLLHTMLRGIEWLGDWPGAYVFVQTPPLWAVTGYYVVLLVWLWSRRWGWLATTAPLLGALMLWIGWRTNAVNVTVLDLNQGTVIFLDLPGERHDVLIDGGTLWNAQREVLPFLRARGVDRLAATILTRADKPHAEGIIEVVRQIPIGEAVHSGLPTRSKFYAQWLLAMSARNVPVRTVRAGDALALGPETRLRVLHPSPTPLSGRSEDNALVLLLEVGRQRVLFLLDSSEAAARHLVETGADLRAGVVVKGEHTRDVAALTAVMEAARPRVVVHAVSGWPSRRYPRRELGEAVRERGIAYYRTDEVGAVTIRLDQDNFTVKPWLQ